MAVCICTSCLCNILSGVTCSANIGAFNVTKVVVLGTLKPLQNFHSCIVVLFVFDI